MGRLFRFLLKLAVERFYGDILIQFQKGRVQKIEVHQHHLVTTLPEPDVANPEYLALVAETAKGVSSE